MKRGKRGGWKRGRVWGLHRMSVVETHKLSTFKHLHLKDEHIYVTYPKKSKNQKQTCLAEIKLRNTTKTPPQTKVHREFNFQFFHSEIWLQSVICFATQDGTECWEKPSLEFLRSPLVWRGGNAGRVSSWLVGKMSDCSLHAPELHRTAWFRRQCWMNKGAESTKHGEPECDCSKGPGPCASSRVTRLGPRRGKGERALSGRGAGWAPGTEMESKVLKPTPGQMESVHSFPKPDEKRSKPGSDCGHREWQTLNAVNWMKL